MDIQFEWDPAKAKENLRKHGVSFDLATRVFFDPFAIIDQDRIEGGERRWQTMGTVGGVTVLVVAHTVSELDEGIESIRIISARHAERRERKRYEDEAR